MPKQAVQTEHKSVPVFITKMDADLGQVEAIVSVFGVVDMMDDVIHPGAYTKTITERSGKIRVLDNHRNDSTLAAIGFPVAMKEIGRDELPPELLKAYPEATGGLWTLSQFLLETPEGKGVFQRLQANALNEWSIGFDPLDTDFGKITDKSGKSRVVRNIRGIRLWEYSVVLWGANQATATIEARNANIGKENEMPTKAQKDAPNYGAAAAEAHDRCSNCLFFQAKDGSTGACSKYGFQASADSVCDGYDPSSQKAADRKEWTAEGPEKRFGDVLKSRTYDAYIACANTNYMDGLLSGDEHRQLVENGIALLDLVDAGMSEDVSSRPMPCDPWMDMLFWAAEGAGQVKNFQARVQKAGRVLSKRNADRLIKAFEELQTVLNDAGLFDDEPADDTGEAKGAADAQNPTPVQPTEVRAGSPQAPTLEQLAAFKKSLTEI